jgi:hypothetical protein
MNVYADYSSVESSVPGESYTHESSGVTYGGLPGSYNWWNESSFETCPQYEDSEDSGEGETHTTTSDSKVEGANYERKTNFTTVTSGFGRTTKEEEDYTIKITFDKDLAWKGGDPTTETNNGVKLSAGSGTSWYYFNKSSESVDVSLTCNVTIPDLPECENTSFTTYVTWVVEDDDESDPYCPYRTVAAYNQQHSVSAARGGGYGTLDSVRLSPTQPPIDMNLFCSRGQGQGTSKAIVHYAAKTIVAS